MIQFKEIQKTYDNGTKALKGIEFRIEDGEFVFLVGPSGSGKSTIVKLITAEEAPTQGRLMVNGYNLNTIRPGQVPFMRRSLGVIFQDFRLIEKKTVEENLTFAMRAIGASPREIRKRIPYVLELVDLGEKAKCQPAELSGGQKAKVLLLKMSMSGANVLILDEPTRNFSALSSPVIRKMLAQFPGAIISISHDRKYIGQVCDRVYRLTPEGLVLEETEPEERILRGYKEPEEIVVYMLTQIREGNLDRAALQKTLDHMRREIDRLADQIDLLS